LLVSELTINNEQWKIRPSGSEGGVAEKKVSVTSPGGAAFDKVRAIGSGKKIIILCKGLKMIKKCLLVLVLVAAAGLGFAQETAEADAVADVEIIETETVEAAEADEVAVEAETEAAEADAEAVEAEAVEEEAIEAEADTETVEAVTEAAEADTVVEAVAAEAETVEAVAEAVVAVEAETVAVEAAAEAADAKGDGGGRNGNAAAGIGRGRFLINAGIGYAAYLYRITLPPISASAEYALPKIPLSAGAYFGIIHTENNSGLSISKDSLIAIGAKASWHFNVISNLDTYAGLVLGLLILDQKQDFFETSGFKSDSRFELKRYSLFYGFNIGARYFFTNNIGAYAEFGYNAISVTSIGLAVKF
jgi:hypothetical protein